MTRAGSGKRCFDRGSHQVYSHPGLYEILVLQPRRDGDAKPYQVRQLLRLIEQYNLDLKE